jgi:SWI/SNF-related matrix-associated actin-dependent regulator of chromatin subfamily A-like protein 1
MLPVTKVTYKGKEFRLKWAGLTKLGSLRALLAYPTGQEFWVDTDECKSNGRTLTAIIEGKSADREKNLEQSRSDSGDPALVPTKIPLRPFQAGAVAYGERVKNVLFADEPGLGKTAEALGLFEKTNSYPALVITPATLKMIWAGYDVDGKWIPGEVGKFTDRSVVVLNGKWNDDANTADIVVVNYENVAKHKDKFAAIPFKAMAVDESHYIKSKGAKRTKAVQELADALPSLKYRILITGTPVQNRPVELVEQLGFLKVLGDKKTDNALMGTKWNFLQRYCGAHKIFIGRDRTAWDFSGASNLEELSSRLRQTCMISRTKEQVLKELLPKTYQRIPMVLTNTPEYDKIDKNFRIWLREKIAQNPELKDLTPGEILQYLVKIRDAEAIMQQTALRMAVGLGKVEAVKSWTEDFLESGSKLVLFAYHREVQAALANAFPKSLHIFAEDTVDERKAAIDEFQTNSDKRLIVVSAKLGGVGITLTAASHEMIAEYLWTPGEMQQCEDRIHRIGQQVEYPVTIYTAHAPKTFDDDMAEILKVKSTIVRKVTA